MAYLIIGILGFAIAVGMIAVSAGNGTTSSVSSDEVVSQATIINRL